jgi:hypothetical protein
MGVRHVDLVNAIQSRDATTIAFFTFQWYDRRCECAIGTRTSRKTSTMSRRASCWRAHGLTVGNEDAIEAARRRIANLQLDFVREQ